MAEETRFIFTSASKDAAMRSKTDDSCPSFGGFTRADLTLSPSPAATLNMAYPPPGLLSPLDETSGRALWIKQRRADRTFIGQYIGGHISQSMRSEKWQSMTDGERRAKVKEWWTAGMTEREKGKAGSLRTKFPHQFSEVEEDIYLKAKFRSQLRACSLSGKAYSAVNTDYDDEEPRILPRVGMKREGSPDGYSAKRRGARSKRARVNYHEDSDSDGDDDGDENGDEEGTSHRGPLAEAGRAVKANSKDNKAVVACEACPRGAGIELGGSRERITTDEIQEQCEGADSEQVQRRRWTWIGDELKIWPPF